MLTNLQRPCSKPPHSLATPCAVPCNFLGMTLGQSYKETSPVLVGLKWKGSQREVNFACTYSPRSCPLRPHPLAAHPLAPHPLALFPLAPQISPMGKVKPWIPVKENSLNFLPCRLQRIFSFDLPTFFPLLFLFIEIRDLDIRTT